MTSYPAGPAKHVITFNPDHIWERYGDMNEYTSVAWIEGLGCKSQGYTICNTPLQGPSGLPMHRAIIPQGLRWGRLRMPPIIHCCGEPKGLLRVAHGCIVEGPDGNLQAILHHRFVQSTRGRASVWTV